MMLFRLGKLFGAPVAACDGEIGRIKDVYFDHQRWTVRYLVVDTGNWLAGRRVLIAPISVGSIDWERNLVHTELTKLQVEADPDIDTDAPDRHLRSVQEMIGYLLLTSDDPVGRVEDLILDKASWAIRYLVIDTRNWLLGKHAVIPPRWIRGVDWMERVINVDVSSNTVQTAPEYHSALAFSRLHETNLYSHYERPGYWQ